MLVSKKYQLSDPISDGFLFLAERVKITHPDKFSRIFFTQTTGTPIKSLVLPDDEITDRIGWKWSKKQLHVFYLCLIKFGFISCRYTEFQYHFFGTNNPKKKMLWLKYKTNLIYIFMRLMDETAIPKDKKIASVLFEHFYVIEKDKVNKKRLKEITASSTQVILSDFKKKDNIPSLDDIIKTVKDNPIPKLI